MDMKFWRELREFSHELAGVRSICATCSKDNYPTFGSSGTENVPSKKGRVTV